jgi:hypothetical protein
MTKEEAEKILGVENVREFRWWTSSHDLIQRAATLLTAVQMWRKDDETPWKEIDQWFIDAGIKQEVER